jgi:histidinol phosphatase-like PHP family hydrolase
LITSVLSWQPLRECYTIVSTQFKIYSIPSFVDVEKKSMDRVSCTMKIASDYHVHTSASHCCKEQYGIVEAWNAATERSLEHVGITDHDNPHNNRFLIKQREAMRDLNGAMLGLEVSIRDRNGHISVSRNDLDRLDFVLLAEHVHIMPKWTFLRKGHAAFKSWWENPREQYLIEKYYDRHATMTYNALCRNHADVVAHPWRFPLHQGILDKAIIDSYDKVIRKAVERDVKIEISRSVMAQVLADLNVPSDDNPLSINLKPWKAGAEHEILRAVPFFRSFFGMCKDLGARFTMGSDAHKLQDIGIFPEHERVLNAMGITEKHIVHELKE